MNPPAWRLLSIGIGVIAYSGSLVAVPWLFGALMPSVVAILTVPFLMAIGLLLLPWSKSFPKLGLVLCGTLILFWLGVGGFLASLRPNPEFGEGSFVRLNVIGILVIVFALLLGITVYAQFRAQQEQ